MSKNKITSVEWLYNNLKTHFEHDGDLLEIVQMSFEQAKEMHKSEHCKTYINAMKECMINPLGDELYQIDAEQYYKETYETNNKN